MSTHQFKPGDVAVAAYPIWGVGGKDTTYEERRIVRWDGGWARADNPDAVVDDTSPFRPADPRPLVVIDPVSDDDLERLWIVLRDHRALQSRVNLGAALREFANPTPPKPDEPQGLGAVVEDSNGDTWVRMAPRIADFDWFNTDDPNRSRAWRNLAAVRVLSEGVVA